MARWIKKVGFNGPIDEKKVKVVSLMEKKRFYVVSGSVVEIKGFKWSLTKKKKKVFEWFHTHNNGFK